ncbi:c-type cytochrome domain-containing protein [Roseibacillus persicicus]|uniref:c-type cytochrome n=1 Tax=Roseibacillus persicicus TaxID=454148 RepID=UPI00398AE3FA
MKVMPSLHIMRVTSLALFLVLNSLPAADFQTDVLPIFQNKCYKCHGNGETKGDMSLEPGQIRRFISKQGPIVPGDSNAQILRMIREEPGVEAMPRQGGPLNEKQIAVITQWVVEGAKLGKGTPYALTQKSVLLSGTWTNTEGKKIEADLLGVEDEKALLRIKGKVHQVPLKSLSEESQAKIKEAIEQPSQPKEEK